MRIAAEPASSFPSVQKRRTGCLASRIFATMHMLFNDSLVFCLNHVISGSKALSPRQACLPVGEGLGTRPDVTARVRGDR